MLQFPQPSYKRSHENVESDDEDSWRRGYRIEDLISSSATSYNDNSSPSLPESNWAELEYELLSTEWPGNSNDIPGLDGSTAPLIEAWAEHAFSEPMQATFDCFTSQEAATPACGDQQPASDHAVIQHVCFGLVRELSQIRDFADAYHTKIYRAAAKMVGNMSSHLAKLNASSVTKIAGRALLNIEHDTEHVWLCFEDGDRFAQMNARFSENAPLVLALPGVTMQGLVDLAGFRQAAERATKSSDATVRVGVNVYGPSTARDEVGNIMSKGKLYLQEPEYIPDGAAYDNPHVLDLDEIPENQPLDPAIEDEPQVEQPSNEEFQAAVGNIYKNLKRGENLEKMEADASLRTELLPHQQQALSFMVQREVGPVSDKFAMWQEIDPEQEGSGFRNRVTNAVAELRPTETGGGVLADAMGLGKTLSVLALIARTRQTALDWSSGTEDDPNFAYLDPIKKRSKATLVLVSSYLLLNHWVAEIERHCLNSFNVVKYHGQRRERSLDIIAGSDIVITTYHTLATENAAKGSPLHDIAWYRTVLDEAHIIRHRQTTFYDACMKLSSSNRWCLTGTPIQNTLDDIGALFTYLKIRPFDNISTFRCYITIPFDERHSRRAAAAERLSTLIDSLCLRRTSYNVDFPEQTEKLRRLDLSQAEYDQYQQTKAMVDRVVKQRYGEIDHKNAFGLFQAQLQLRLLCNHGTFQNPFAWTTHRNVVNERESIAEIFGHAKELRCACCGQPLPITSTNSLWNQSSTCNHVCCLECLEQSVGVDDDDFELELSKCPVCASQNISSTLKRRPDQQSSSQLSADYFRQHGSSTKMNALITDLMNGVYSSKSIVFSCWTRTLDLVERHLFSSHIPYARIDGSSPLRARQKVLDRFDTTNSGMVLLMTTGTGAFGLNIPAANRVFIVEPQWNPHTERQAIARATRIGQRHPIVVYRYVVNHTVEQEMRSQQERKLHIAEVGW